MPGVAPSAARLMTTLPTRPEAIDELLLPLPSDVKRHQHSVTRRDPCPPVAVARIVAHIQAPSTLIFALVFVPATRHTVSARARVLPQDLLLLPNGSIKSRPQHNNNSMIAHLALRSTELGALSCSRTIAIPLKLISPPLTASASRCMHTPVGMHGGKASLCGCNAYQASWHGSRGGQHSL